MDEGEGEGEGRRTMEAKLATESLYISSIVLLPSSSPLSITISVFFV
jgi:hypothetical protein